MEDLFGRKILQWCEKKIELSQERRSTIQFGLVMGVEAFLKTLGILVVGAIFQRLPECFVALVLFCGLRLWAGGFHCRTSLGCFAFMVLVNQAAVFGAEKLRGKDSRVLWIIWPILLGATIRYAPMNSEKNPITDQQFLQKKKTGACIWVAFTGCLILVVHDIRWKWIITLSVLFEVLTFLPVIKKYKGGFQNEGHKKEKKGNCGEDCRDSGKNCRRYCQ